MVPRLVLLLAAVAVSTGCHAIAGYDDYDDHGGAYAVIPPRYFPPPGRCRIWIPEWPVAHQSDPGRCGRLEYRVPPGGWLIVAPYDHHDLVEVWVFSYAVSRRDGLPWVVKILFLDPYTGELIGEEYL